MDMRDCLRRSSNGRTIRDVTGDMGIVGSEACWIDPICLEFDIRGIHRYYECFVYSEKSFEHIERNTDHDGDP